MRNEDSEKLAVPAGSPIDGSALARAVNIDVPALPRLHREIMDDLDTTTFGIRWWASQLDTSRRILIGHHLVDCVKGVEDNLVEASLHRLEAIDYWERESNFLADVVSRGPDGSLDLRSKPRLSPADDLPRKMATLHAVGAIRAIGSALDCLGACIIAVLALPKDLLRADFGAARTALNAATSGGGTTPGADIQRDFRLYLDGVIDAAGPPGWLPWTLDFRNMVVHRGRRWHTWNLMPRPERLYGFDGQVIPRAMAVEHLPADPAKSQVEAWVAIDKAPWILMEHAEVTLTGIQSSAVSLVSAIANRLVDVWVVRRATPSLLNQPARQWPKGLSRVVTGFSGYKPGSSPVNFTAAAMGPDGVRLMKAAALDDAARGRWASFSGDQ